MEEYVNKVKIAMLERIGNALKDTNIKIIPSDLKILADIIISMDIRYANFKKDLAEIIKE